MNKEGSNPVGVDYKHVQLLESKDPPAAKLDTIEKLAKVFKISPSNLLYLITLTIILS